MSKEYVDKELAGWAILDLHTKVDDDGYVWVLRRDAFHAVDELQSANVEEVVTGKWELFGNDDDTGSSYFCSNCHASYDEEWFYNHGEYRPFDRCPHCGAMNT